MSEWIKCSDRLPENNQYVIASDGGDIEILRFQQTSDKRNKTRAGDFYLYAEIHCYVTHWMPLPPLPIEVE